MLKKILAIAIIGLVLPGISQAASFEKNLTYGIKNNDDVRELQEFLKDQKFFTGPITGNYFSLTRSAVIRFQQKNGVKPANGQFSTSSREIAQKLLDPEQNVTEPMDEPSAYLDYPIGTTLQTSIPVVGFSPELSPTPFPQTVTPTVIYYPVFVPQETTVTTSAIEVSSTPVVETPKDITAPKMTLFQWTRNKVDTISWYPELVPGVSPNTWGNRSNSCKNCLAVITDEPSKIKVEYTQFLKDGGGNYYLDAAGNKMTDGSVSVWDDGGKLSYDHIFILKPLFQSNTSSEYTFRITITDQAGNINRQRFGNVFNEKEWSNDQTITYSTQDDPNRPEYFTVLSNVLTTY